MGEMVAPLLVLSQNVALLLSLVFLHGLIMPALKRLGPRSGSVLSGALYGLISILGMLTPFRVAPGIIVDGRVVVVALAGVFDGPASGLVAGALVMALRSWLGGVGTIPGEGAILTAFLLGALVHWRWRARVRNFGHKQFLLLGATLAASGMLWTLALPDPFLARRAFRMLAFPVGLGFPVATLLLGTLLSHQIRRREAEEALAKVRQDLERQVFERTADLSRSNVLLQDKIAERKRAEENLREAEECFRLAAQTSNDVIYDWDIERSIQWFGNVDDLLGYDPGEFPRTFDAWVESVHPDDRERVSAAVQAHLKRRAPYAIEYRVRRKDGTYRWWTARGVAVRTPDGNPVRWIGTVTDITERKKAEEEREESEQRFRRLSEATFEAIVIHDEGKILDANQTFAKMFGYELSEVIGKNALDFTAPEYRDLVLKNILSEYEKPYEVIALRKDGSTFVEETRGRPIPYEGRIVRVAAIRDITERKRADEALRVRTQQLDTVRAVTAEISRELDLAVLLELINRRAGELVGAVSGTVRLWDEQAQLLIPVAWHGLGEWMKEKDQARRLGEGLSGTVAQRRLGMIVNDYRTSPFAHLTTLERTKITAVLAEPLIYRDHFLGVLTVDNHEPGRAFTERDQEVFRIFASHAAIAIENARLYEAAQREIAERKRAEEELRVRTRQLGALRAISVEITRELDLTAVLQLILARAMELVGVTSGGISLWDETAQVLVPRTWHGLGARVGEVYIRLGEGVAGVVAERREGMIVNDYQTSPYVLPDVLECLEISAILAEPLMYGERLVGVLILFNMETGRSFTEQDRQTLALFATQAAIAIENARLHQTTVQRAKQLATLNELMRKLTTLLDPPQLAREILQAVQDLIPNAVSRLWEYVEGAGELHLVAGVGLQAAEVGYKLRLRGGEGLLGTAIATRQPVISPDVVRDPRFVNKTWGAAEGLVSSIALPLVYGERVTGGLGISTRQPHDFTDEEVNLLQSFAAQAAIALENARLFEQVRDGRERLQALSRRLVEVQEAERRNIARELHDEIGQLLTGLKLLLEMSARVRPEKVMARLGEAQSLANELMMRVRELSLDLRPAMLDDLGILPALLWHFERFTELSKVQVLFRHSGLEGQRFSPEVETAAYRIVQEALTNVARHAKVAEVAVRLWVDENALDLRIEDRGAGFDPEATLSAAASSGLAGMRERAALLGGRLTVTSTPGSGTQVMAELPLAGRFEKRRKPR